MMLGECVENLSSFKDGQKDENGDLLAVGSCKFRIGGIESNLGQVSEHWVRPATFSRRVPAIGEICPLITGPCNDYSSTSNKGLGLLYLSPLNSVDDLNSHSFSRLWKRKSNASNSNQGQRPNDKEEFGRIFKEGTKVSPLQIFEADDLFEGRFGQSIRFGSTMKGDMSIFSKKPTWDGSGKLDPLIYIRVKKPSGGSSNKYTIEDIEKDESTIVLTSNQKLKNFKAGFDKNKEAKKLANFDTTGQIAIDSGRVVLNAKKDMLLLIGKTQAILTGKKVIFQSEKYNVDLDDLMDFLKKWLGEDVKLHQGSTMLATPAGPSGISSAVANYIQLQSSDFTKFKQP